LSVQVINPVRLLVIVDFYKNFILILHHFVVGYEKSKQNFGAVAQKDRASASWISGTRQGNRLCECGQTQGSL